MKVVQQGRRRRAIAAAATTAAAAAAIGVAVPALAASAGTGSAGTGQARVLGAGQTGNRAQVPWRLVGPGWSLALYSARQGGEGVKPKAGPSTLYLVDPAGGRYKMISWRARSPQTSWYLQAWSGDMRRALFIPEGQLYNGGIRQHVYQLQLRTGKISGLTLPSRVSAMGYTRPDGLNILAQKSTPTGLNSNAITLQRYNLAGQLQATLAAVQDFEGAGLPAVRRRAGRRRAAGPGTGQQRRRRRQAAARAGHQGRLQPGPLVDGAGDPGDLHAHRSVRAGTCGSCRPVVAPRRC